MLGDTNGDFKRKLLGKTEEKVRGYRSVALSHYCGNGYAFCVMISRKLGLDKDREFLRARTRAASAAERWRRENRHGDFLLHEGKPLEEAGELLKTRRDDLDPETIEFIDHSIHYRMRQRRLRTRAIAATTGIVFTVVSALAAFSFVEWRDALEQKQIAVGQKLDAERNGTWLAAAPTLRT